MARPSIPHRARGEFGPYLGALGQRRQCEVPVVVVVFVVGNRGTLECQVYIKSMLDNEDCVKSMSDNED